MQKIFKSILSFCLAIAVCLGTAAICGATQYQVADAATVDTYYNGITATGGTQLLGQLHDLITTTHTYYTSYNDCKADNAKKTDPGSKSNTVMEFYTHIDIDASKWDVSGGWNREHVWAKSDSNGLWETSGAGSDLHHIRPAEKDLNNHRGNMKYGEVTDGKEEYTSVSHVLGGHSSGSSTTGTFEPLDNVKGDVARILMYVYTHYNTYSNSIFGGNATTNGKGNGSYFGTINFTHIVRASNEDAAKQLLLKWNKLDPVDQIEIDRNNAVYAIEHNRNPFIDNSSYADAIWGGGTVDPNPGPGPTPGPSDTLQSIRLNATSLNLGVGDTYNLTVTPTPSNASKSVIWYSYDDSVATVSDDGIVKATGAGTTAIAAISTVNSSIRATATVTVKKDSPTPTPSGTFEAGTYRLALNITASDITKKLYFTGSLDGNNYGLTTTDVNNAAEVVAEKVGDGYTLKVGGKYLELEKATNSYGSTVSRIVLSGSSSGKWSYDSDLKVLTWTLTVNGKSYYLGSYTNSSGKTFETISSSETKYISGTNAENVGVTQFPVSFEKIGGEVPPTPDKLQEIYINPSEFELAKGESTKLTITSVPSTARAEVVWSSSDTSVVTVSQEGVVTAISAGTATIMAVCKGSDLIWAAATVTVTEDEPVVIVSQTAQAFHNAVAAINAKGSFTEFRTTINTAIEAYKKLSEADKKEVSSDIDKLNAIIVIYNELVKVCNGAADDADKSALNGAGRFV